MDKNSIHFLHLELIQEFVEYLIFIVDLKYHLRSQDRAHKKQLHSVVDKHP